MKIERRFFAATLFASMISLPNLANAGEFRAGEKMNHKHTISNNTQCDTIILRLSKSWSSQGGVIALAKNNRNGEAVDVSAEPSGTFSYEVNKYVLKPRSSIFTYVDFETNKNSSGSISTQVTWSIENSCSGKSWTTSNQTSTIVPH